MAEIQDIQPNQGIPDKEPKVVESHAPLTVQASVRDEVLDDMSGQRQELDVDQLAPVNPFLPLPLGGLGLEQLGAFFDEAMDTMSEEEKILFERLGRPLIKRLLINTLSSDKNKERGKISSRILEESVDASTRLSTSEDILIVVRGFLDRLVKEGIRKDGKGGKDDQNTTAILFLSMLMEHAGAMKWMNNERETILKAIEQCKEFDRNALTTEEQRYDEVVREVLEKEKRHWRIDTFNLEELSPADKALFEEIRSQDQAMINRLFEGVLFPREQVVRFFCNRTFILNGLAPEAKVKKIDDLVDEIRRRLARDPLSGTAPGPDKPSPHYDVPVVELTAEEIAKDHEQLVQILKGLKGRWMSDIARVVAYDRFVLTSNTLLLISFIEDHPDPDFPPKKYLQDLREGRSPGSPIRVNAFTQLHGLMFSEIVRGLARVKNLEAFYQHTNSALSAYAGMLAILFKGSKANQESIDEVCKAFGGEDVIKNYLQRHGLPLNKKELNAYRHHAKLELVHHLSATAQLIARDAADNIRRIIDAVRGETPDADEGAVLEFVPVTPTPTPDLPRHLTAPVAVTPDLPTEPPKIVELPEELIDSERAYVSSYLGKHLERIMREWGGFEQLEINLQPDVVEIFLEAFCADLMTGLNRKLHRKGAKRDLLGLRHAVVGELKKMVGDVEEQRKVPEELSPQEIVILKEYLLSTVQDSASCARHLNERLYLGHPLRASHQLTETVDQILRTIAEDEELVIKEVLASEELLRPRTAETELPRWREAVLRIFPVDEEMLAIEPPMAREAFTQGLELEVLKGSPELVSRFAVEADLLKARKIIDFVVLQTEALIEEIHGQDHLRDVMAPCWDFVRAIVGIIDVHDIDAFTIRLEAMLDELRLDLEKLIS